MSYPTYSDLELEIQKLEEENKKLKSEIENMKKVGRENIETLDRMSIELENYSKSFKRYRDFSKQELADSLYDSEEQNKKLNEKIRFLEQCLDNKEKVNISLREENRKLKDDFMKMLYMYYNYPTTSNEIANFVKERYSEWYDAIKDKMKEQIMKEI